MLQAGETLAGYRIEAIAGVGGMGVVYRATQLSLERRVALKVLSTTLVGDTRFRERFRLEGRHAAALDHPNIIPVYEAGESNGLMFIAMRFVDGPTLADMVMQQALSGRETLRILRAISSALDAAHDSGLIHRDVKPHNILMTSGGHPYLADFGITKGAKSSGLTHSGDFVGSVSYVSPEQIDGRDVTPASDVYSLTAVLFHCLTGTLPYDHDTEAALMHAHLFAPPPTISGLGVDAPSALDEVFARGMAKSPEDRFARASELIDACGEALAESALDRCPALVPGVAFGSGDDPPDGDPWARDAPPPVAAPPAAAPARAQVAAPPAPAPPHPAPAPPAPAPPQPAPAPPAPVPAQAAPAPAPPRAPAPRPAPPPPPAPAPTPAPAPEPAPISVGAPAGVLDPDFAPVGDATAADRRRETPAPAPAPAGPRLRLPALPRRRLPALPWRRLQVPALIAAGVLVVVAVPVLGYSLGDRDEPAGPATARSQSLQVSYVTPWEPSGATIDGLGIDGAVGLRRPDGTVLVAGRLRDPSPGFDPAPAALRSEAARRLVPARVRLNDREGVRYAVPLRAGGSLWMIAFPDSKGWTTVACRSTEGRPDGICASVAATVRSRTATPIGLDADTRVAKGLDRVIARLNRVRDASRQRIGARSTRVRSRAFTRLADADQSAARSLGNLELRPQEAGLFGATIEALRSEAKILRNLARAARGRRRATYNRERGKLRLAERRVRAAMRDL